MGKHVWRGNDLFARPRMDRAEESSGSPRPPADESPAGARRFLFYGLLGAFGLVLALAAAWVTLEMTGGFNQPRRPVTLLLVGVDHRREDIGRTDTIILATYKPQARKVEVVWIPRDTRVLIPGYHYYQKINVAYALGGVDLTRRTVESLLGVKVDYHFLVDFQGFVRAVDALGGVTVNVPRPMDYDDFAQNLHIHLRPGEQRLSGTEALGFVRYRSDGLGDISLVDPVNKVYEGRLARQQQFVQAVVKELLKPYNVWRLPGLIRVASQAVETDMPLGELIAYARAARGLNRESVVTCILPGEGQTVEGASYWVPEPGAVARLAAGHRSFETAPEASRRPSLALPNLKEGLAKVVEAVAPVQKPLPPARVSVLNGTGEPGLARRAAARLESEGLVVASVGNARRYDATATRVIDVTGRRDAVAKVKKLAPDLEVLAAGRGGEEAPVPEDVDLVIVVGPDFRL
ncbi:MAG: LCP family protein [Bacillota bacterium]|nr:LCP family protein [Bacillota bacterium]